MPPRTDFPPVRACLFDMDGLLLDTEDLYTLCVNLILNKYGRPELPWSIKAKLQGRPAPTANEIFHDWAQLPISKDQYLAENTELQNKHFSSAQPLPGVPSLLADLWRTRYWDLKKSKQQQQQQQQPQDDDKDILNTHPHPHPSSPHRVHIALATSSRSSIFATKTNHLADLFAVFETDRRVLGDDERIPEGRGKPLPDIYLIALKTINDSLPEGEQAITPEECLVFEDSVPGVEAGRRAGMRVVWCPHPMLKQEYDGREKDILAGRMFEAGDVDLHQLGEHGDGWADYLEDLVDFPYAKFGIEIPPLQVDEEPCMRVAE